MANIGRAAALASYRFGLAALSRATAAWLDRTAATFGQLELERTGERIGLGQAQLQPVTRRIARAAALAHKCLRGFLVADPLAPQRRTWDQPVAAQPQARGDKDETPHPAHASHETTAHELPHN